MRVRARIKKNGAQRCSQSPRQAAERDIRARGWWSETRGLQGTSVCSSSADSDDAAT